MDLFVVPTIGFNLLYVLIILRVARRELVWVNVTPSPTSEVSIRRRPQAERPVPQRLSIRGFCL
jgi:hypothetical protein